MDPAIKQELIDEFVQIDIKHEQFEMNRITPTYVVKDVFTHEFTVAGLYIREDGNQEALFYRHAEANERHITLAHAAGHHIVILEQLIVENPRPNAEPVRAFQKFKFRFSSTGDCAMFLHQLNLAGYVPRS